MRIELKSFTERDFETLKSWVGSKEELFQFAGTMFTFSLTNDQLEVFMQKREVELERNNHYGDLLKDHPKRTSI